MVLNRKKLAIAIPLMVALGAYAYLVPIHNLFAIQNEPYKCQKASSMYLQLDNGTIIPCKQTNQFFNNYTKAMPTSFNRGNT